MFCSNCFLGCGPAVSFDTSSMSLASGARGRLQTLVDATIWPRMFGNCHTHRDTERIIANAGFQPRTSRHEWQFPSWVPMPVSELALGIAVRP